jgi:hypothetical protein
VGGLLVGKGAALEGGIGGVLGRLPERRDDKPGEEDDKAQTPVR